MGSDGPRLLITCGSRVDKWRAQEKLPSLLYLSTTCNGNTGGFEYLRLKDNSRAMLNAFVGSEWDKSCGPPSGQ